MARNSKSTELMKRWMGDSLLLLMQKQDLDKITAADITEKAGVGRASWFRNFHSKQEAITFALQKRWEQYAEENGMILDDAHVCENAILFFKYMYEIRHITSAIYKAGVESTIYDAYTNVMVPSGTKEDVSNIYHQKFFAFGLIGLVDEWIKRDYTETPEQMTNIFLNDIFKA